MSDTNTGPMPVAGEEIADDTFEDLGTTPTTDADNAPDDNTKEATS